MAVICRCRKACMNDKECNAVTWIASKKHCILKKLKDGYKGYTGVRGYSSFVFCDGKHRSTACATYFSCRRVAGQYFVRNVKVIFALIGPSCLPTPSVWMCNLSDFSTPGIVHV